jgi:hypothetical protein
MNIWICKRFILLIIECPERLFVKTFSYRLNASNKDYKLKLIVLKNVKWICYVRSGTVNLEINHFGS